ncbi:MAG: T9SS type A sorting domain-containing protein, partial [Bacteroidota bacterium]
QKNRDNSTLSVKWKLLGPIDNPPSAGSTRKQGLGRVNRIRFAPNDTNVFWAASASGGVWKTIDGGKNWFTFPFTQFLSLGVSDIAISPRNPNIVYAATGDCEPSFSAFYSIGVIKTTNGGQDWTVTKLAYSLEGGKNIGRILVHPDNPNIVLAATKEGIFKTTDGGDTWVNKSSGNYFIDMEFMPNNPNIIYASTFSWSSRNYIYKSDDNGETWRQVHSVDNSVRIAIDVTPADSYRVFAVVAKMNSSFNSIWASFDKGDNWELIATPESVGNLLGRDQGTGADSAVGQGYYDLCIAVSPVNKDEIYVGGINIWKSTNSGDAFSMVANWIGSNGKAYVHADQHDLIYKPNSKTIYATHDGGIDRSYNQGKTWENISDGMSISQFYRIGLSGTDPTMIIGGCQDNGTRRFKNGEWTHVNAGDGMDAAIDPKDANRVYCSSQNGSLYRSTNGGNYFSSMVNKYDIGYEGSWITPFIINPVDTKIIYAGYREVYSIGNYGANQPQKISNFGTNRDLEYLALCEAHPENLYAATGSEVNYTSDAGQNWTKKIYSGGPISSITCHPESPKRLWVTKSGFSPGNKVFEWDGTTWKNISGNLPNVPVNCIVYQKNSPDRLYLGTDIGVFYTDYNSGYWLPFGTDLPPVVVYDLEIQNTAKKLRAATFGRGVWEADIIDCNLTAPTVKVTGQTEFCQGDSVIIEAVGEYPKYEWSNGDTTSRIVVKESGSYALIVYDDKGCNSKSQGVIVNVKSVNNLAITTQGKPGICNGDSVTLVASFGFQKYQWSTGDSVRKIFVKTPGKISLLATAVNGCSKSTDFDVKIIPEKPIIWRDKLTLISSVEAASYQWYLDGTPLEGKTQRDCDIGKLGTYRVEITDTNGCKNSSDTLIIISDVKEEKISENAISVYPNPNKGNFTLKINSSFVGQAKVTITNSIGMLIQKNTVNLQGIPLSAEIRLENVPNGTYMIYCDINGQTFFEKIIKE